MKKILFSILWGIATIFISSSYASAFEEDIDWDNEEVINTIEINENLEVSILRDGRVKPVDIKMSENLTESELDEILVLMGHDTDTLMYETKLAIVTSGGKAPESDMYTLTVKEYDKNNQLVSKEIIDLNEVSRVPDFNGGFSTLASNISQCAFLTGCFEGNLAISYLGKSGSNHLYRFTYNFEFPKGSNSYNDRIGLAWKGTGTKKVNSDVAYQESWNSINKYWMPRKYFTLNKYNIYGSVYNVPSSANRFRGKYQVDVYYSNRYTGDKEIIVGNYAANWQSIVNGISIGPASINVSYSEKQYILERNFTVGR